MIRPLRHWLIAHSATYRRYRRWRLLRSIRRTQRVIGERLIPAVERATQAMQEWADAYGR